MDWLADAFYLYAPGLGWALLFAIAFWLGFGPTKKP
jgi:hypothetical protein